MNDFSAELFAGILALVGLVILVSALLSGFIERSGVPQVAVFLALGAALGPAGIGVLNVNLQSPALRVIATLSLVLVLFTDAVSLDIKAVMKSGPLAFRVLGPGTLLSAGLIGLAGWGLLGLSPAAAAILGAALASTDPVLLRGLLRRPTVPSAARQALRLESGLNDIVLLPIVLIAMLFLESDKPIGLTDWAKLALDLFILGPGAGVAVGLLAVSTLDLVRRRVGIRRDYESLYSLGVAFTAFAAAEAVHGSGFLSVFAAGMTIAALDVELCDCFLEYGETTAEMALLFTFVIFGGSLIWGGFAIMDMFIALFMVIALLVRPVAFFFALLGTKLDRKSHFLIAWFGPRGLSSLLLVLLPVFAGLPGTERLFNLCCLVVVFSVVLHGGGPLVATRRTARKKAASEAISAEQAEAAPTDALPRLNPDLPAVAPPVLPPKDGASEPNVIAPASLSPKPTWSATLPLVPKPAPSPEPGEQTAAADSEEEHTKLPTIQIEGEFITIKQMQELQKAGASVIIVDARTDRTYNDSDARAKDAIRLHPDQATRQAAALKLPRHAWLVVYCT